MTDKVLTDKQQKFLEVLFTEAGGDYVRAKLIAGYSENTATSEIVRSLKDEIITKTEEFLNLSSAKAAVSMVNIMDNPTDLGNREKMAAAKDILDRAGFKPKDKLEVSAPNPLFILPAKTDEE